MEDILKHAVHIDKKDIGNLKFPSKDVLSSDEEIKNRKKDLDHATKLGNAEHGKIKIFFQDHEGLKKVETTVWSHTEKYITLKAGVSIPIHCIHKVSVF